MNTPVNPAVAAAVAQAQAAQAKLNVPVQMPAAATPTDGKVAPKTYHNRIPNSSFYVQIAPTITKQVIFHAGKDDPIGSYTTDSKLEQDQLDACADTVGCPIFTKKPVVEAGEAEAQRLIREQAAKAALIAGQAATPTGN